MDLTGQRIGYLTVINKTDERDYKGSVLWKCHCDCGKDVLYSADMLVHGNIKSCGCYRKNELCGKINDTLHRIDGTCIERLNLKKARSDNKSGHVGIHMINENAYQAWIGFKGKRYYLGTYSTLNEAINARQRGEQMHLDFLEEYYRERKEEPTVTANTNAQMQTEAIQKTVDVSKNYRNFSGISDDMSGQVKFIYRTDEIKSK